MTPEWSVPIVAARVPEAGQTVRADAEAPVRAAVAARLGVPGIDALAFEARLVPTLGGAIAASGTISVRLTQVCVITLEPFDSKLSVPFDLRFVARPDEADALDPDAPDEIALEAGVLDLGEAVVQTLALALDPYPHAPGAALPESGTDAAAEGPFAALARRRGGNA